MPERRAFVAGHPIAHSRSPLIHNYWLRSYGLNGTYAAQDVAPEEFGAFLERVRSGELIGGNVTIPHKEMAYHLVDHLDEAASAIGAVNTVWIAEDGLHGSNTDAYGFAANLDQRAPGWDEGKIAVVLGAGGAARAIIHALRGRGFADIRVFNRSVARAEDLAAHFGPSVTSYSMQQASELSGDADLVVNATALGMDGKGDLPIDVGCIGPSALVTDIVYVPLETPLLAAAAYRGLKTADGLGMLLHQAVPGFERWFGVRPAVTEALRTLVVDDLARHA